MTRKTIKVADLRNQINEALASTHDDCQPTREALQTLLERILMDTGNYKGFAYLTPDHLKGDATGGKPGIYPASERDRAFEGTDHTRVYYS